MKKILFFCFFLFLVLLYNLAVKTNDMLSAKLHKQMDIEEPIESIPYRSPASSFLSSPPTPFEEKNETKEDPLETSHWNQDFVKCEPKNQEDCLRPMFFYISERNLHFEVISNAYKNPPSAILNDNETLFDLEEIYNKIPSNFFVKTTDTPSLEKTKESIHYFKVREESTPSEKKECVTKRQNCDTSSVSSSSFLKTKNIKIIQEENIFTPLHENLLCLFLLPNDLLNYLDDKARFYDEPFNRNLKEKEITPLYENKDHLENLYFYQE